MSCAHRRQAEACLLVLAGLFLYGATFVVAGCGGQSGGNQNGGGNQNANFEGTWMQAGQEQPITVTKVGDKYTFTTVSSVQSTGAYGYGTTTTDTGGTVMIESDPTASGNAASYAMPLGCGAEATQAGDKLTLPLGDKTAEITVSGDTMTIVVSGVDGVFTFSRATTSPSP